MTKKYCVDMSGFSNPVLGMPQDIYVSLWTQVRDRVTGGSFAVTREIYDELIHIQGDLGDCIRENGTSLVLEVGDNSWDWPKYIEHAKRMQTSYAGFISEFIGGNKGTVGLNDLSIVALGKTLALPVVSMELPKAHKTDKRRAIPDICALEKISHMTFNDFLRAEGITL